MTGEGGRGYGIDESGANFENDNGYSKLQKRAEMDTVQSKKSSGYDGEGLQSIEMLGERYRRGEITEEEYDEQYDAIMEENPEAWSVDGAQFSISRIEGEKGDYGLGVILDTDVFDGVHPRNWGTRLGKFVYEHLAGKQLTIYDENGNEELVHVAREKDRVKKDGAKNSNKVINKLARYKGDNTKALATVHLSELLETSVSIGRTDEHKHQWLDERGWELRRAYIADKNGKIYEAILNIGRGRDRNIIYAISNVTESDKQKKPPASTASATQKGREQLTSHGFLITDYHKGKEKSSDLSKKTQYSVSEIPTIEDMPKKAQAHIAQTERQMVREIGASLSIPMAGRHDFLQEAVHRILWSSPATTLRT